MVVGLLTGIAGVGGGFAIVPALVLLAGLLQRAPSWPQAALVPRRLAIARLPRRLLRLPPCRPSRGLRWSMTLTVRVSCTLPK